MCHFFARYIADGCWLLRELHSLVESERQEVERLPERFPARVGQRWLVHIIFRMFALNLKSTSAATLQKQREKGGTTTRKLIGHSGPVYAVDFDPISGSADAPRYLLSASADATTRLWSLDTMTNVVAYRGHQNPVWDVQWSPMGIYFATASRDKTARLWSTDRTSTLRIYAGHLSDVEVCGSRPYPSFHVSPGSNRPYAFIQTHYTWPRLRAIGQRDYGMCSEGPVYACSLATKASCPHLPSVQMASTSPVLARTCPSTCGILDLANGSRK